MHQYRRRVAGVSMLFAALLLGSQATGAGAATSYDWPQFFGNPQHTGDNTAETTINASNVSGLRKLFTVTLPDAPDGAPAELSNVSTTMGVRDLLFITGKGGTILAADAHSGLIVWRAQFGSPGCMINNGSTPCYTTSSPAVDPNRQYVYTYGLDGHVHKLSVYSGAQITGGGWPELVTTKPFDEKMSPALSIATAANGTTYLYAANGGYPGDRGDYQGHITTINLATGSQTVFNTLCSNQTVHFVEQPGTPDCSYQQSAVWARPGVVYDPATDRIYLATGNGPWNGSTAWSDSVLALHPDGTGSGTGPLDSYTPTDYQTLQNTDADLGSTAPAILPVPSTSKYPHIALQGGKDSRLRLINLDNLSNEGGPGHTGGEIGTPIAVPQGGEVLTQPSTWVNPADGSAWVFVSNDSGISGFKIVYDGSGNPSLAKQWQDGYAGSSPLIANGVLYLATGGVIRALSPLTGQQLWSDTTIGGIHWQTPVVANGTLYIMDNNAKLNAYALPQPRAATYVVNQAPTTFPSGSTVPVSITITNTGTSTWAAGGSTPVHLGVHFATRGGGYGVSGTDSTWATNQRFTLPSSVAPGQSITLTVPVTAPSAAGNYILEYQMVQENVAWFPQYLDTGVDVGTLVASYSASGQPTTFTHGGSATFTITVTNTGSAIWFASGPAPFQLGIHFAVRGGGYGSGGSGGSGTGTNWLTDQHVRLPANVYPGQSITLSVTVTAPSTTGTYVLEEQMVEENVMWFPQYLDTTTTVS